MSFWCFRESGRLHRSGKIVTPLKDRIGSEIKTTIPLRFSTASPLPNRRRGPAETPARKSYVPVFVKEIVEGIAFKARADQRIDKRSV
jgi:magnesium chelatase subunit I